MRLFLLYAKYWGKEAGLLLLCLLSVSLIYFFRIPGIELGGIRIANGLYRFTAPLELKEYLILYFISVFFINGITLILLTILLHYLKEREERLQKKYEILFIDTIMDHLMANSFEDYPLTRKLYIVKLKRYLKENNTSLILLNVLRKIHSQVTGDLRLEINQMIIDLDFNKKITTYLRSPYLSDKILALKFISGFQLEGHTRQILKLTGSKNYVLRTEAFVSLIKLSVFEDLAFLKNHMRLVSFWDINAIVSITREFGKQKIDFESLILSASPRVSALGIVLASEYNRTEFKELIKSKLDSRDRILRNEAYQAFLSMADRTEDLEMVIGKFKGATTKIKQIIIRSFVKCPDPELATSFLMGVVEKESLNLKTLAMKVLIEINPTKVQFFKSSKDEEIQKAHMEAVDLYIN